MYPRPFEKPADAHDELLSVAVSVAEPRYYSTGVADHIIL